MFKLTQDLRQFVAVADVGICGKRNFVGIFLAIVSQHNGLADAFGLQLARECGNGQCADSVLAACHGHPAVVQNLVSDIDARGNTSFDGKRA